LDLIETLGREIGVRMAGTPAAERAASEIAQAFRELGLEPRLQPFQFLGYEPEEPELEINGERWPAGPCLYADPTPVEAVEGRVRRLGTWAAIPEIFEAPIFVIEDDDRRELARLFGNPLRGGGAIPFPATYTPLLTGPTAIISAADVARLDGLEGARARLRTGGRFDPGRRDANVIAELPGESEEVVLVGAHFDSVWRGPGVIDNATGVEGLRRVAERLVGRDHPRSLVFAAFAAEEYGLIGSKFYVDDANTRGELDRIVGVVNLDCIAHGDRLELMVGPDELRGRAVELARTLGLADRYPMFVQGPETGTDHYYFALERIPAASILFFPYPEYHLPGEDESGLVDEQKLADAVELAVSLVESQLARPVAKQPRTPPQVGL
jgi:hypothetical protein